jgi:AcrR family transcriptional regulator
MSSIERRDRIKVKVRKDILDAAMKIIKEEGSNSLSIKKVADMIEYSPPIIYSYFLNKEAVLIELSKQGYAMLIIAIQDNLAAIVNPKERMETMLKTYVRFALEEHELYELIYTVGSKVADIDKTFPISAKLTDLFRKQIQQLVKGKACTEDEFRCNYLLCVAFVHGLVGINRYYKDIDQEMNNSVLNKAIKEIVNTMECP